MRIMFFGDVMGRAGRSAIINELQNLRSKNGADFVIINAENASSGLGLSSQHAMDILSSGADCITLGDHAFDQKDMMQFIEKEPRIIRPLNYAKTAPGKGANIFSDKRGRKILVSQILGQVFMKRTFDDPFSCIDSILKKHTLGGSIQASFVDIHCEATSDAMLLPKGTAYQTDAGMCGDYDSVIGMEKSEPLRRFVTGMAKGRFSPATGSATLCGVLVETDDISGKSVSIEPFKLGGKIATT